MVDWLLVGEQNASFTRKGWKSTKKVEVKGLYQSLRWVYDMHFSCFMFSLTSNIIWLVYMYIYVISNGIMLEVIKEEVFLHDWWNVMKFEFVIKFPYIYVHSIALNVLG